MSLGTVHMYDVRIHLYSPVFTCSAVAYGSSEAIFSVNTRPAGEEPAYAVVPTLALVEFLPVDESGSAPEDAEPLLADQVKVMRWCRGA